MVIHQFSIVIGLFLKYFYLKIYCINIFLFFKIYLSINLSKQFKNINLKKIIFLTNTQSAEPCYQAYSYILFQIDLQTESNNHVSKKKKKLHLGGASFSSEDIAANGKSSRHSPVCL